MNTPPNREVAIFTAVLELAASQRAAYLHEACADDPALRLHLEALLRDHEAAGAFLETPPPGAQGAPIGAEVPGAPERLAGSPAEKAGDRIGRYKLLQQIGEGGCGVVYMAEQEEPVRRRVALKVIKLGMDTKQVIARFEAERQAVALMDHPNIAKVFDAGATETGRSFFVMELVKGIPITRYCDENHLGTEQRLRLFVLVCQAIQHAHQKGIIHRDIKPSNILVADHDGVPVPKIIDFGIAKATTDQRLTDKTVFTAFEQFIGTPAYMSPEQAKLSGLDIDTRSDIYSLGVLLYELLTGSTPFDSKALMQAGLDEIRRTIREQEPVRPSTRLSTMAAADLTEVAKQRHTEPAKLGSLIRGDLDWIVMKALEKDRARRYETANGLARDIQRHLNCEPVLACPPSRLYEFQKTVRRHKLGFAVAAALITVLAVGVLVSTSEALRAARAEREQSHLREQAQKAQANEVQLRRAAEAQELVARQKAYGADMNLVQQALALSNLGRARALLDRQRPLAGEQDLRGWEWRFLWQQCQSEALSTLGGERYTIGSLEASYDGKWLAVGETRTGVLSVWNTQTRQWIARFNVGEGDVRLAFAHRTPLLAYWCGSVPSAGSSAPIGLWDGTSRHAIPNCTLAGPCQGLAFSGDDKQLVTFTAAPANELAVWEISTGRKVSSVPVSHPGGREGTGFAVLGDLSVAAIEAPDGCVRVLDLKDGKELWKAKAGDEQVTSIALSGDGRILASATGVTEPQIRLWDARTGKELGRFQGHKTWIGQLVFTPDGAFLASASSDQTLRLWDVAHLRPLRVFQGHTNEVWRVVLLANQHRLFSGAKDGSILEWDLALDRAQPGTFTLPLPMVAWQFGPDSKSVITVDRQGHVDRWYGHRFDQRLPLFEIGPRPVDWRSAISPQVRLLAVGYTNGTAQVWDLERRALLGEFSCSQGPVFPVGFLARETKLLLLKMDDASFHEWDLRTGAETRSWQAPRNFNPYGPAFLSPDEQLCLVPESGWTRDLATGTETRLEARMGYCDNATFSPDGRRFAIASYHGYARMWDASNWKELATFSGFLIGVHSVAFSPDSTRLAAGSAGKEALKIWDTHSLQELLTLEGMGGVFLRTAFSRDGNIVGSMNEQGMLHLWRAPSWAEILAAEKAQKAAQ